MSSRSVPDVDESLASLGISGAAKSSPSSSAPPLDSEPPRQLDQILILIELRTPDQGLTDPASRAYRIPITLLVFDEYKAVESRNLRACHISFDKLIAFIQKKFGFPFDSDTCELAYTSQSIVGDLPEEYHIITSELAFQNAVSVMHNCSGARSDQTATNFTFYLWNPVPKSPRFRRSARASNIPKISTGDNPTPDPQPALPNNPKGTAGNSDSNADSAGDRPSQHKGKGRATSQDDSSSKNDKGGQGERAGKQRKGSHSNSKSDGGNPFKQSTSKPFNPSSLGGKELPNMDKPEREDDESDESWNRRWQEYLDWQAGRDMQSVSAGLNSKLVNHLSKEIWERVCAFFNNHNPEHRQPEYVVAIRGFGRYLLPVQALTVWHYFKVLNSDQFSLFVGHVMGIGKTTIAFAIHFVQHAFNHIWAHIRSHPGQHYPKAQLAGDRCPSYNKILKEYGFQCPCMPNSPTHFVKERLGITAALVPAMLLQVWITEAQKCYGSRPGAIRVVVAHGNKISSEDWKLLHGREELLYTPSDDDNEELNDPAPSKCHPRIENSALFVICTSHSWVNQWLNHPNNKACKTWSKTAPPWEEQKNGRIVKHKAKTTQFRSDPFRRCIISIFFRDEFQLESGPHSKSIGVMDQTITYQEDFPISIIPMSGTPLTTGPENIAYYVRMMSRDAWANDAVLSLFMGSRCIDLGLAWKAHITGKVGTTASAEDIIQEFTPLVEKLFIRFTVDSDFLGYPPVRAPVNTYTEFVCSHTADWTQRLENLRTDEEQLIAQAEARRLQKWKDGHRGSAVGYVPLLKNKPNSYYRARICASIPGLMDLKHSNGELLKLTEGEWLAHTREDPPDGIERWIPGTDSDPYFKNLSSLVASSAKLTAIGKKLDEYDNVIDAEGKGARSIWCSYFFVAAYVQYLWMIHCKKFRQKDVIWLNGTMTQKDRSAALDRFHANLNSDVPLEKQHTARYIVATTAAFAIGITLNEAMIVAFLEPDFRLHYLLQGYARHCRQGNKNKETQSWMFLAKDNHTETRIQEFNSLKQRIDDASKRPVDPDASTAESSSNRQPAGFSEASGSGTVIDLESEYGGDL